MARQDPIPAPAQPRGRERVEAILDAATAILIEEGYGELSMRKTAERAGIAVGNLQYYFPAKADLIAALVTRICDTLGAAIGADTGADASAEARFATTIGHLLRDMTQPSGATLLMELWALSSRDEAAAAAVNGMYLLERDVLAKLIGEMVPDLAPAEARLRAQAVTAMTEGAALMIGPGRAFNARPGPIISEIGRAALALAKAPPG